MHIDLCGYHIMPACSLLQN